MCKSLFLINLVKVAIIRCHPDLAGRLADEGALSRESEKEQKSAGLDNLAAEEKQKLRENNNMYKEKFSFPFVICVRLNKKQGIMDGIEQRLQNGFDVEVLAAIEEIKKIGYLRLTNVVSDDNECHR